LQEEHKKVAIISEGEDHDHREVREKLKSVALIGGVLGMMAEQAQIEKPHGHADHSHHKRTKAQSKVRKQRRQIVKASRKAGRG
jgi:hypothetical protein